MGEVDAGADVLVIFGITGDLARKMTFQALYRLEARKLLDCPIVGVGSQDWTVPALLERARSAIRAAGESIDDEVFARFAGRWDYLCGDVTTAGLYHRLADRLDGHARALYYLELPPALFAPVVEALAGAGLVARARVAVEKPFGHDLASARALDDRLHAVLSESQILRVDHFLGKEPVIELEYLRFANQALAALWDRDSVSEIHITMAEDFGVEDRGAFYDKVGTLRDVVANHLLQVLALVAMDPPVGPDADDLRDKKVEVFRAMPALDPSNCVRGQYAGYTDVAGVAPGSGTETFVACRLGIDNWRWAGVPIFLRAGKALRERVTEVRLFLRRTPSLAFLPHPARAEPNQIVLRVDPDPGLRLALAAHGGHCWRELTLDASFAGELGPGLEPYERLLHAALVGEHGLFARQDAVEATWRIVAPLLEAPPALESYPRGTWGPAAADVLVRGHHAWRAPWLDPTTTTPPGHGQPTHG